MSKWTVHTLSSQWGVLRYDDLFIHSSSREYKGLYKVMHYAIRWSFYRYNCKLLPRDDFSKTCQYPHNLCTMTFGWPLECRSLTFSTPKVGILFTGIIRRCSKKKHENILNLCFTRRKKEMPTICYELGNYYLILTNIVLMYMRTLPYFTF